MAQKAKTVIDVILGEAKGKSYDDMVAVASVIDNRSKSLGVTPQEVVGDSRSFNAYGRNLPSGVNKTRSMAQKAWDQVQSKGPVHNATFYATPATTKNLPKGLSKITQTDGHVYFNDPQGRSIRTTRGFKRPNLKKIQTVEQKAVESPIPTVRPDYNALEASYDNKTIPVLNVDSGSLVKRGPNRNLNLTKEQKNDLVMPLGDKNNAPTNLLGVFDKPNTRNVKHVGGKNRPHPPADEVMAELQNTAEKHIPKGYTVKITSGTGEYKSRRHRKSNGIFETGGSAADVEIYDPQGKPASQAIRKNFVKGWAGETKGGVGMGNAYMGKDAVHVDLITEERRIKKGKNIEGMQWGHGHNSAKSLGLDAIRNSKYKYLPTYPDAPTPRPKDAPKTSQGNYYDQVPNARMGETVNPINEAAKTQLGNNPVRTHTLDPKKDLGGRSGSEQRGIPIPKKRPNRFNAPIPTPRPNLETIFSKGQESGVSNGVSNSSVSRRGPLSPVNTNPTIFPSGSESGSGVSSSSGNIQRNRLQDIQHQPIHARIIDDFDAKRPKAKSKNIGGYDEVPMIVSDPIRAMQEKDKNPYMPLEPVQSKGLFEQPKTQEPKSSLFNVPIPQARPEYRSANEKALTPAVNNGPYEVGKSYDNKNLPMAAEGRWSMGANEDGKKQTYLGPNNPNDRMNPLKYIFSNLFPSGSGGRKFSAGGVAGALLGGAVGGPVGALIGNKIGGRVLSGGHSNNSNDSGGSNNGGGSNFSGAPSMRNVYDSGSDNNGNSWQVASNGAMGRNVRSNTNKYGVTTYTDEDTGNQLGTSGGKSLFSGIFG